MGDCQEQRLEDVVMFKLKKDLKLLAGSLNINKSPSKIFEKNIIEFLSNLSQEILGNKNFKIYPDLISFGFWCRKTNLLQIKKNYASRRLSRGIAFHICPANVPMNFAFSMCLGLLSGNSNVVRIPSIKFNQVSILCNLIKKILKKKKFLILKKKICLISFPRSDHISNEISKIADVRLIWGGDKTVQNFKSYETKPRCIDLNFANRYSFSVINSKIFNKLSLNGIRNLSKNFFTDTYTMDQNGCSSPKSIFWIHKTLEKKKKVFWDEILKLANNSFDLDLTKASKKYYEINKDVIRKKKFFQHNFKNFKVVKINLKSLKDLKYLEYIQPGYGVFVEANIKDLRILRKFLSSRSQTMTYFGYSKNNIEQKILDNNFKGVDRVVKIGNAFQMSHIWDGFDIINILSREVHLQ